MAHAKKIPPRSRLIVKEGLPRPQVGDTVRCDYYRLPLSSVGTDMKVLAVGAKRVQVRGEYDYWIPASAIVMINGVMAGKAGESDLPACVKKDRRRKARPTEKDLI